LLQGANLKLVFERGGRWQRPLLSSPHERALKLRCLALVLLSDLAALILIAPKRRTLNDRFGAHGRIARGGPRGVILCDLAKKLLRVVPPAD
jgi:hypothetical protein